jgi:hypothetical protein
MNVLVQLARSEAVQFFLSVGSAVYARHSEYTGHPPHTFVLIIQPQHQGPSVYLTARQILI